MPVDGYELHLRTRDRNQLADPEQSKIAMTQRRKGGSLRSLTCLLYLDRREDGRHKSYDSVVIVAPPTRLPSRLSFSAVRYIRFFRLGNDLEIEIYRSGIEQHGKNSFRLTDISQGFGQAIPGAETGSGD